MAQKNIYVALRPRPLDPYFEGFENSELRFDVENNAVWIQGTCFFFDHVFDAQDSNDFVYNVLVQERLKVLLEGYNFSILAYGQTGSGKSYTMGTNIVSKKEKSKENNGIITRILEDLFDSIKTKEEEIETSIKVSFMELYNDSIIDLLTEKLCPQKCQLREVSGTFKIKNLTEKVVNSATDAMVALKQGSKKRKTACTDMNLTSSRSHAVFFVFIEQRNRSTSEIKYSKLQLIDLAGSERCAVSGTSGDRLKEGNYINKGLFELSNVIQALYVKKKHIPYRNSKLTQLLRDSFGGNNCTIMIACISLVPSSGLESINTIRYASIARKVENTPLINRNKELREIQRLRKQVQELETALHTLMQTKITLSSQAQSTFSDLDSNSNEIIASDSILKSSPAIAEHISKLIAKEPNLPYQKLQASRIDEQEKENVFLDQNVEKGLEECTTEKDDLQKKIAALTHTIKLQSNLIQVLKDSLDTEREERVKTRHMQQVESLQRIHKAEDEKKHISSPKANISHCSSAESMMGEYLADLEDEENSCYSINSSDSEDGRHQMPGYKKFPFNSRKRTVDMKKDIVHEAEEVPSKHIVLSCSCPAKALCITRACVCIKHKQNCSEFCLCTKKFCRNINCK